MVGNISGVGRAASAGIESLGDAGRQTSVGRAAPLSTPPSGVLAGLSTQAASMASKGASTLATPMRRAPLSTLGNAGGRQNTTRRPVPPTPFAPASRANSPMGNLAQSALNAANAGGGLLNSGLSLAQGA